MRLILTTISSAVLLSGCSWFGGQTSQNFPGQNLRGQQAFGAQQFQSNSRRKGLGPCQVYHAQQAVPRGCHPSEVTIATRGSQYSGGGQYAGGFPQQPNFGAGYGVGLATGGFGSHANSVRTSTDYHVSDKAQKRKPRFRGQFSIGGEKNIVGDLIDSDSPLLPSTVNFSGFQSSSINPITGAVLPIFGPGIENEAFSTGTPADGEIVNTTFSAAIEEIDQNSFSFEDAYSTPISVRGGFEYIVGPKTSLFASAGYVYAEGERASTPVQAELLRVEGTQAFTLVAETDLVTGATATEGVFVPAGPATINISTIPNVDVAFFDYEFSDLERIDFEAGARQYFNPILGDSTNASITPFIGGAAGVARYNSQSLELDQRQLFLQEAFDSNGTDLQTFEVFGDNAFLDTIEGESTRLFNSQWVPTGTVTAGLEWQATPRTALAFEAGVRFEGGREDVNGNRGDNNVSIPFTIRGSYNF